MAFQLKEESFKQKGRNGEEMEFKKKNKKKNSLWSRSTSTKHQQDRLGTWI